MFVYIQADELAAGLLALGVQTGDRVGIWSPNCPEWIIAQYATARAGMILVNQPYTVVNNIVTMVECAALLVATFK